MTTPMPLETSPADWREKAHAWIKAYAMTGDEFSADDLRDKLPEPHHSSAWGNAFLTAKSKGLLIETGYLPSRTKSRRHSRILHWVGNPNYFQKEAS